MLIDDDTILNIANEVHRSMPPDADDQQEVLAVVREVLAHIAEHSAPPPAGWLAAIERVRGTLGRDHGLSGPQAASYTESCREYGGLALDAAIDELREAEAADPKRPPPAVRRMGGEAKLLALARQAALHCEERYGYLPATEDAAATFLPHQWVLDAMSLAAAAGVPAKDMHDTMEVPMHDTVFNAVHRVYFRAGLLAFREAIARAIEPNDPLLARDIRAAWWPALLGANPGEPRPMAWNELTTGGEEGPWAINPALGPSTEALSYAHAFLSDAKTVPTGKLHVGNLVAASQLCDTVLAMNMVTPLGLTARRLARVVAGIPDAGSAPDVVVITTNGTTRLVPAAEPVFLVRGQDALGALTVRFWADSLEKVGGDPTMAATARALADMMDAWPTKKVPDLPGAPATPPAALHAPMQACSVKHADDQTLALLDQAVSELEARAEDQQDRGNDSTAAGCRASAHAVQQLMVGMSRSDHRLVPPPILKGIGKIAGDGWKDTTKVGEVVYVWGAELQAPYAPGQFLRVGNDCGWTASRHQFDFAPATTDEVRELFAAAGDKSERRAITFGDIVAQQVIAMQAAVIDAELRGDAAGTVWIRNTLMGPGHYPDIEAAKAMGGAQAWFDAKIAEHEAFRAAHPAPGVPA